MRLSQNDIAYLRDKASAVGYNPDDILKVINYESSGRPDVWGGKNNQYYGLIQFGPNERKQFGVDTVNPSATNQIDATLKFLDARGFRPGMGLLDLYSTVNAGSPGHYKASDGNGTVLSHVAAMQGIKPENVASASPATGASEEHPVVRGGLLGLRAAANDAPPRSDAEQLNDLFRLIAGSPSASASPRKIDLEEESLGSPAPMVKHLQGQPYRPNRKKTAGLLGQG